MSASIRIPSALLEEGDEFRHGDEWSIVEFVRFAGARLEVHDVEGRVFRIGLETVVEVTR